MRIDDLLAEEGFNHICEDCPYFDRWEESHPYGDTVAYESLAECSCSVDSLCPRLEEEE